MTTLYLDLETVPTQRQDICDYIERSMRDELTAALAAVCAPANYKDADKIASYCADKREQLQAEFLTKLQQKIESTSLDGSFGQVFCIGWALNDNKPAALYGMDERDILTEFAQCMSAIPDNQAFSTTVVGHNVSAFDLRFLYQRFVVNGIRPPLVIARAAQAKPWEIEKIFDTMVQWAGVGNCISLDKLCLALSVPSPKGELDGSKVWQWVQDGRHEEVSEYCKRDVEAVRAVHRRMTFQTVEQFEDVPA